MLLQLHSLAIIADTLLSLCSVLLETKFAKSDAEFAYEMLENIFGLKISLCQMSKFICSIRHQLESNGKFLQAFLKFVESNLLTETNFTSNKASKILEIMGEHIMHKRNSPIEQSFGCVKDDALYYFNKATNKDQDKGGSCENVTDFMLHTIEYILDMPFESANQLHYSSCMFSCFVCLPFSR